MKIHILGTQEQKDFEVAEMELIDTNTIFLRLRELK